jgi:hypothetical protein
VPTTNQKATGRDPFSALNEQEHFLVSIGHDHDQVSMGSFLSSLQTSNIQSTVVLSGINGVTMQYHASIRVPGAQFRYLIRIGSSSCDVRQSMCFSRSHTPAERWTRGRIFHCRRISFYTDISIKRRVLVLALLSISWGHRD